MNLNVPEILQLWRDGERLLAELPAASCDRATVAREVSALRARYRQLTELAFVGTDAADAARDDTIEHARRLMREVRDRLGAYRPAGGHARTQEGLDESR